jgi:hypothetical protein
MYFFILDKNNERPDLMTDLKHTDPGKKMHVKEIYVMFMITVTRDPD